MHIRWKWSALLLILALLASLLGACAVTPAGPAPQPAQTAQEDLVLLEDGQSPAPEPGEETPLPEDGSYTTHRLGGRQPGALLPRQVHRGRPLRQPGGSAALRPGPDLVGV